jgi:hypothetical protein
MTAEEVELTQATLAKYIIQQTRHGERDQRRLRDGALLHFGQSNLRHLPPDRRLRPECLDRFLEFSLDVSSRVPNIPHRFRESLLRYTKFVGPVLNFVRLQETDAASVLRTFVGEVVGHGGFSDMTFNAASAGEFPRRELHDLAQYALPSADRAARFLVRAGAMGSHGADGRRCGASLGPALALHAPDSVLVSDGCCMTAPSGYG